MSNTGTSGYAYLGPSATNTQDVASVSYKAAGAFAATFAYTSAVDVTAASEVTFFILITDLGTNTSLTVVIEWSDDTVTVPFDGTALQLSDDSISNGSFTPYAYTALFTTATSTLITGTRVLSFPVKAGYCRLGLKGTAADGSYSVRAQRLAR